MSDHLITTTAKIRPCPCGAITITGYAEGLRATVDLTPINRVGLIAAILANRPTYRLHAGHLVEMTSTRINSTTIRGPTLAAHRCRQPILAEHRHTSAAPVTHESNGDTPPY